MSDMATERAEPKTRELKQYDFNTAGDQIAATLTEASENLVTEAQNLHERTMALTADIKAQLKEQADLLTEMNHRIHVFGESMLEAHRRFISGK